MKLFLDQNYYEMLDLKPDASPFEIRHAYKKMYQLYGEDSLASYSFFSPGERKQILLILERAFHTLIQEDTRAQYDRTLIEAGVLRETMRYRELRKSPTPLFGFSRTAENRGVVAETAPPGPNPQACPYLAEIVSRKTITGADLKQIREDMGITLEYIWSRTKVRRGLLRAIEEDRFEQLPSKYHLRQYLTFYVQCLNLDAPSIVERYMDRVGPGLPEM
jgi:hypothetical protein